MHRPDGDKINILPMAARTATSRSNPVRISGVRGIILVVDVKAKAATPNISAIKIYVRATSGRTGTGSDIAVYSLTALTINDVGVFAFVIAPNAGGAAGWTAAPINGVVPPLFEVEITHDDADSITYQVDAFLVY